MAGSRVTLAITVKVDPANIASLEGLARDAQALADRLRAMGVQEPADAQPPADPLATAVESMRTIEQHDRDAAEHADGG